MKETILTNDWAVIIDVLSSAAKSKNHNEDTMVDFHESLFNSPYQLKAYLSHKSNPKVKIEIKLFK